jgi:hypothetical protein
MSRFWGVTIDGVCTGELDLLTTCIHHSELQVITVLSLISTIKFSQFFTRRFLAMASNRGDSSASRAQVLVTVICAELNPTHSSLLSLPCRAQLNCHPLN